jgi:hypothetical protein
MLYCDKRTIRLLILLSIPGCLILGFNFFSRNILSNQLTRSKSLSFHRFARPKVGEMTIAEVQDIQGGAKDPLALLNVTNLTTCFHCLSNWLTFFRFVETGKYLKRKCLWLTLVLTSEWSCITVPS